MSIQEENTRQLRRLVKEQAETISKLKELTKDAYFDGISDGYNDEQYWAECNAYKAMIKL